MFVEEYARLKKGVRMLSEDSRVISADDPAQRGADPLAARTINIPGWEDIIKLGVPTRSTAAERQEFYAARKERRAPTLDVDQVNRIRVERAQAFNRRQSAQPQQSRAWGEIMTAIDNVQDFVSTVASAGRLAVWAATRIAIGVGLGPGAVEAGAILTGKTLVRALAAERASLLRRFGRMGLGLGFRAVPVVGHVLLVSDLLNLLNLIGMVASPVYGLLCSGPSAALAAAAPTLVFKRSLKQDIWKKATINPFGRNARADRQLKAMRGRLGFPEIIEALQTTNQLFGWGVSFGAVVGAATEIGAVASGGTFESGTRIALNPSMAPAQAAVAERMQRLTREERQGLRQAGAIGLSAPVIMRVQEHFTDEEHLIHMLGYGCAVAMLRRFYAGIDMDELASELVDTEIAPPLLISAANAEHLAQENIDIEEGRRWWWEPYPRRATLGMVMDDAIATVPAAVAAFIEPRRNTQEGVLFGAMVTQLTEQLWEMWGNDREILRWRLAPDFALLASAAEAGVLIPHNNPEGTIWALWMAARRELQERDLRGLERADWDRLAAAHSVQLWHMAPPDARWPPSTS